MKTFIFSHLQNDECGLFPAEPRVVTGRPMVQGISELDFFADNRHDTDAGEGKRRRGKFNRHPFQWPEKWGNLMKPIWQIDSNDVIGLQGRDVDFAQFVNDLLAQQVSAGRLPTGVLQLTLKTRAPDGGIDAAVSQAIPSELDPEGFFSVPTCWQYKASTTTNIKPPSGQTGGQEASLRDEIGKWYARQLIEKGYSYRFCIADDMPPSQKADWEGWLLDEARKYKRDASPPKVVTADDLARWANRLPGAVLPFRPYLGLLRSLRTWGREVTSETPRFIPIAAWEAEMNTLRDHADLNRSCHRVLQPVRGEAGVGKTRCVYESLVARAENLARVVYTTNEVEAEKIAEILANEDRFSAILVADECSVDSQVRLERRLQPHSHRLRLIAVDNRQQEEPSEIGEVRLVRMSENEVEQILETNSPELPRERRWSFVRLSGGFIRLARDLCTNSHLIPPDGSIGPVLSFFRNHYLRHRLPAEDQKVVEAIALLSKVGYKGDLRRQLEWLCQAVDLQPNQVVETATKLKQAPGFIAKGELYLYVTPQLIRQAAFQAAWSRWIDPDPEHFFLNRLQGELFDQFAEQLRSCGTQEMGRVFFRFFRDWTSRLTAADLADKTTVERLVRFVEIEPKTLLPHLRRLIESTSAEELQQLHRGYSNGQPARRALVWLADKLLRLHEHFADAERILLRLALAETETYGNNASEVWKQLFRPLLSGTPIPFAERLLLLEQRFQTTDQPQLTLCLGALEGPLTADGPTLGRPFGPPVVAGRIPPSDWVPKNGREMWECWTLTVNLMKRLSQSENTALREGILGVTFGHLPALLRHGFLADVIEIIGPEPLPDACLARLLHELDRFLDVYCARDSKYVPDEVESAIRQWRRQLVPGSLHGQLVSVIGQEPWHLREEDGDHGEEALAALARELLDDPAAFERELPWLCSREARSAVRLGLVLGKVDGQATQLGRITKTASTSQFSGIARGYIEGLVLHHPEQIRPLNELLDRLQSTHPQTVFDLLSVDLRALRPLERLLAMVDAGQLPVEYLRAVAYRRDNLPLNPAELRPVVDRLTRAAGQGNEAAASAALHVFWMELQRQGQTIRAEIRDNTELRALLQTVLEIGLAVAGQEAHAWLELLNEYGGVEPQTAIRLAVQALARNDWHLTEEIESYLATTATHHADTVMRYFGMALLDPATGWRLAVHTLRELVGALPREIVIRWLDEHGHSGAVALARHLPIPRLDASGNEVVPEVTGYVLEHFADDDDVFHEFCGGAHSGEMHWGDIAAQLEQEGEVARRFLDHPLPRVRQWAQFEIDWAAHEASWWRARDEEMSAP
jgi:hypothetical protein